MLPSFLNLHDFRLAKWPSPFEELPLGMTMCFVDMHDPSGDTLLQPNHESSNPSERSYRRIHFAESKAPLAHLGSPSSL